ncbi:MAG: hypothetical protein GTO14_23025 [Anaerolineales bacterium]|nr:hypothetical protein [Anaerolineales bacterium]
MKNPAEVIKQLMEHLAKTREDEVDCDEVFRVLDVYAEVEARGEDAGELLPMVKQHLEICECCHEELEAVIRILEAE